MARSLRQKRKIAILMKYKNRRLPIVIKSVNYLNPVRRYRPKIDKKYSAMNAGKRISENKNIYYEYRKNRADLGQFL